MNEVFLDTEEQELMETLEQDAGVRLIIWMKGKPAYPTPRLRPSLRINA